MLFMVEVKQMLLVSLANFASLEFVIRPSCVDTMRTYGIEKMQCRNKIYIEGGDRLGLYFGYAGAGILSSSSLCPEIQPGMVDWKIFLKMQNGFIDRITPAILQWLIPA